MDRFSDARRAEPTASDPSRGGAEALPAAVYQTVFEASFGMTVVVDDAGHVRALSDAARDLFPNPERAVGSELAAASWWADPKRVRESVQLARGGVLDRFTTAVLRDGAPRTLLVDVQSIPGPDTEPWFLLEARDVTSLLASEAQLHDAHAALDRERSQLRAVLDATPDAIAAVDAQGRVSVVNQTALDLRLDEEEALRVGEEVFDQGTWGRLWARALGGETVRMRDRREATPDRPMQWLDLAFAPVSVRGAIRGAVLVAEDVTAQVQAEEIEGAVEAGLVGTFVMAADGRLIRSTAVLRALFGRPKAQSADDLADGLLSPDDALAAFSAALDAPGRQLDLRARLADNPATLWVRGSTVAHVEGPLLVGVAYDTTPLQDPGAAERWADLVEDGGWGGQSGPDAQVDLQVPGPPPDPEAVASRLNALRQTGLLDGQPSEAYSELTRFVSTSLGVPLSLVSLIDEDRQVFVGSTGAEMSETPLSHSLCQHVANERRPMIVTDARETVRLGDHPAVSDLDVIAYLGVPVAAPNGHVIGALCAIDHHPHAWTEADLRLMSSLAEAVTAEVAAHQADPTPDS